MGTKLRARSRLLPTLGPESFTFPPSLDWMVYTSHEASTTFAGQELVRALDGFLTGLPARHRAGRVVCEFYAALGRDFLSLFTAGVYLACIAASEPDQEGQVGKLVPVR